MSPAPGAARLKAVLAIYTSPLSDTREAGMPCYGTPPCQGRYELLVSPAIIREMARVLRFDFAWQDDRVHQVIRLVAHIAHVVTPHIALSVVKADPDDNRILECAVAGKADIIVSNDHHLLDLKICAGIPIIAGPDFRRTLGLK